MLRRGCRGKLGVVDSEFGFHHDVFVYFTWGMGYRREVFTEKEDERLCRYLAIRIPDKKSGGRSGNAIYKQLTELVCGSFNLCFISPLSCFTL